MQSLQNGLSDYVILLDKLKKEIRITQLRATIPANAEFLSMYWRIGKVILEQEKLQGWGQKVVVRLVADLKAEFPITEETSVHEILCSSLPG